MFKPVDSRINFQTKNKRVISERRSICLILVPALNQSSQLGYLPETQRYLIGLFRIWKDLGDLRARGMDLDFTKKIPFFVSIENMNCMAGEYFSTYSFSF